MTKPTYETRSQLASVALFVMALGPLTALTVASDSVREPSAESRLAATQGATSSDGNGTDRDDLRTTFADDKRLSDIAAGSGSFEFFQTALQTAKLNGLLSGPDSYTLLIPTDEAFAELPADRLDMLASDPQAARTFLESHIIRGRISTTELMNNDYARSINGTVMPLEGDGVVRIAEANVVASEVANNGVVHVIDAVL